MERIVIFGATGDLTARYLIPALAKLYEEGKLPDGIKIIRVDRRRWGESGEGFRALVLDSLERHAGMLPAATRKRMAEEVVEYCTADVTDAESVISALEPLNGPIRAYLALPPAVFAPTIEALKRANVPDGSGVAIEKPFAGRTSHRPRISTGCCTGSSRSRTSSASTTSSPGSRSRPSWDCASPMASSNRCGTATT